MHFLMFLFLSLCSAGYAAEETIENAMQDIQFSQQELDNVVLILNANRAAFHQCYRKKNYIAAGNYLQYLYKDEQNKYKRILLQKALERRDLDLLSLLDDFDANLLSPEEKKIFKEPYAVKRKKVNEDQIAHQVIEQFDVAAAIAGLSIIPSHELTIAYMQIVAAVAKLSYENKLIAIKYIAEFGPIPLIILFCSDVTIDMVEILTHVCCIGRTNAVIAILENTKNLLHVNKHANAGDRRLIPIRHKRLQPLFTAYKHGHRAIVRILITAYPRLLLYSCDNDPSHTIFYEAMIHEDYEFIKELLTLYPTDDKSEKDYSVLQIAAAHGNVPLVEKLLFEDFLPKKMDFFRLNCTRSTSPWVLAAMHQHILIIKLFIEALVPQQGKEKKFVLKLADVHDAIAAAIFKKDKKIINLLYKTFPGLKWDSFVIPGYFDRDIIEFILQNNFICYDKEGTHFVNAALSLGYIDIIERLMQSSYDFNAVHNVRKSVEPRNAKGTSFFQTACLVGNIQIIQQMCLFFDVGFELSHVQQLKKYVFEGKTDDKILKIMQILIDAAIKQVAEPTFYASIIYCLIVTTKINDSKILKLLEPIFKIYPNILDYCSWFINELFIDRPSLASLWENELTPAIRGGMSFEGIYRSGRLKAVRSILTVYPESIDNVDSHGRTPLHYACLSRGKDALETIDFICATAPYLIKKKDRQGCTSFHSILYEAKEGSIHSFSDAYQFIEKIKLLLKYDEDIFTEECDELNQSIYGASTNLFLKNFVYELVELYRNRNATLAKTIFEDIYTIDELSDFLDYLARNNKPIMPFVQLEALFDISSSYENYADDLTVLGMHYAIPEFIYNTDRLRSQSFLKDLLFLFQEIPDEMEVTLHITKRQLIGITLIDAWNQLKKTVLECLDKNPEDAAFKAVCQWLCQSRTSNKEMSRINLLFSPIQMTNLIIDRIKNKRNITGLISITAQYFDLKTLFDEDRNTLLHHAIKYRDYKAVLLLSSLNPNLLQQKNRHTITPMDLLPDNPSILHRIMGMVKINHS